MMKRSKFWMIPLLAAMLAPPLASGQSKIYSWEDEKGNLHFVDALEKVPTKHRSGAKARAEKGELAGDGKGGNMNIVTGPAAPAPVAPATGTAPGGAPGAAPAAAVPAKDAKAAKAAPVAPAGPNKKEKAYWTGVIQDWKNRKAKAQADLAGLDAEQFKIRNTTPANFQQALADIETKRQNLQAAIDEADRMLETEIPADARRNGVPPGWLR